MSAATTAVVEAHASGEKRWTPTTRGWGARIAVLALIFGGILWTTATVPAYWADRISLAAIWAIIGLSLNVVLGYVGQVSLGHHGFVGIAAFIAAYYATKLAGCPNESCDVATFFTAIVIALISGAVAAGLLGVVALRIKGLYLALITLVYGFVAERSIFEMPALTGGGAGMPAPRPKGFVSDTQFAFLAFVFLALVIFVDWRLVKSKVGRAIISIKHSEPVGASYGINVTAYKILAFIVSGMFAGLAGALLAFRATNVVSNDFTFATGLLWVLMVVVGGLGNRVGVVVASAFFALFPFLFELATFMENFLENTIHRPALYLSLVLGSALAILTIIQYPGGIGEQISPLTRWLGGKRFSLHPEGHGKHEGEKKERKPSLLAKFGAPKHDSKAPPPPPPERPNTKPTNGNGRADEQETAEMATAGPVRDGEES
jgi:branched-chain amino acid transport system permease protein